MKSTLGVSVDRYRAICSKLAKEAPELAKYDPNTNALHTFRVEKLPFSLKHGECTKLGTEIRPESPTLLSSPVFSSQTTEGDFLSIEDLAGLEANDISDRLEAEHASNKSSSSGQSSSSSSGQSTSSGSSSSHDKKSDNRGGNKNPSASALLGGRGSMCAPSTKSKKQKSTEFWVMSELVS